jgi:hypothetical protein
MPSVFTGFFFLISCFIINKPDEIGQKNNKNKGIKRYAIQ